MPSQSGLALEITRPTLPTNRHTDREEWNNVLDSVPVTVTISDPVVHCAHGIVLLSLHRLAPISKKACFDDDERNSKPLAAYKLKGDTERLAKFRIRIEDPPIRKDMVFVGGAVLANVMKDREDFWMSKAEYEEKIRIAEANIGQAVSDCDKVAAEHKALIAQKNELTLAMKSGGSAVQDIIDKTKRVEEVVHDLKTQVDSTKSRLNAEEDQKVQIQNQCGRVKGDAERLRGDIKMLDSKAETCEEDKVTKDNQIPFLRGTNKDHKEQVYGLGCERE